MIKFPLHKVIWRCQGVLATLRYKLATFWQLHKSRWSYQKLFSNFFKVSIFQAWKSPKFWINITQFFSDGTVSKGMPFLWGDYAFAWKRKESKETWKLGYSKMFLHSFRSWCISDEKSKRWRFWSSQKPSKKYVKNFTRRCQYTFYEVIGKPSCFYSSPCWTDR